MQSPWILALIIMLFTEGLLLGLNPNLWKQAMSRLSAQPSEQLRRIGLGMCTAAVLLTLIVYWSRL